MKQKLFILDDNQMMRTFLVEYFSSSYEVYAFESDSEALFEIDNHNFPDAILLDYQLNEKNGIEVLNQFKNYGCTSDIPVLLLSGNKESDIKINCLRNGALDYITKPFNPEELSLRIQKAIRYEVK